MHVSRQTVDIVTATGGGATVYSGTITGRVGVIVYTKDGTTPLASTADFTVTAEATGEAIWSETNLNASKTVRPVAAASTVTGAASSLTETPIWLANDRVKIVVAQGGSEKLGSVQIVVV
jgi:hypothetical protein